MPNLPQKKNVPFRQVLTALLDDTTVFPPAYLRHFSDLEGADLEALKSTWPQVKPLRRAALLDDLEDVAEADTLVSFDNVARMALRDEEPRVRITAARLLWETDDPHLVPVFIRMLREDPDSGVRAAAATALGLFVYLGEVEEIPAELLQQVEEALLQAQSSADEPLVRRKSLESLGYSSRPEVPDLIRTAYNSTDSEWTASALFAISRSADNVWEAQVIRLLRSPKANIQLEAVRAAGELQLENSRRILLDLLEEEAQDSEIRAAIFWSLSQIGGEEVRETLEEILEETEDEEEVEILEEALDNLSFTEDVGLYGMADFADLGLDGDDDTSALEDNEEGPDNN